MPKVYIKTFGCQMNTYDSEQVMRLLATQGFIPTDNESEANVIILNTCSVRQHAEDRVLNKLHALQKEKEKRPELIVGLMGCMANEYKEKLLQDFSVLDFIMGTRDFPQVVGIIRDILHTRSKKIFVHKEHFPYNANAFIPERTRLKEYVPIMRGCDQYCAYCIVPYVRGREISRRYEDIISEVKVLVSRGTREITLLGQNVTAYGKELPENVGFSDLLAGICTIEGLTLIRFMTSHPKQVSGKLFRVMAEVKNIEKHVHLPVQSGSNEILKKMNRGYTREEYIECINELRMHIPYVSITTDIIVGFPGEGIKEYEETKTLMNEVAFDDAFIFKYSPRKGTTAARFDDDVPLKEKKRRNNELLTLKKHIAHKKNAEIIGTTVDVFVESGSKKSPMQVKGRTWTDKEVVFDGGGALIGSVVKVKLTACKNETFVGERYHSL